MVEIRYRMKFEGDDADRHRLPAHYGAQSIEGMTWAFALIGNYAATGTIRKRGKLDKRVEFFLTPAQRGSYVSDIIAVISEPQNLFITSVVGSYAVATATDSINALFAYSYRRVCGLISDEKISEYKNIGKLPSGDLEAIVDAIEPSIQRAHSAVAAGANTLTIQKGRTSILTMDTATKSYVHTNIIVPGNYDKIVSVGALNVNSGNGRVYINDIGKTVPISITKEPRSGTYAVLSESLNNYARGRDSDISIHCREILGVDGRIKKLIVLGASRIEP